MEGQPNSNDRLRGDLSFPGSEPIVLHRSFGTCALVIIPPLNYRDTSDRVTLLVLTISEDIIFLRRWYKLFRLVPLNLYAWKKYGSEIRCSLIMSVTINKMRRNVKIHFNYQMCRICIVYYRCPFNDMPLARPLTVVVTRIQRFVVPCQRNTAIKSLDALTYTMWLLADISGQSYHTSAEWYKTIEKNHCACCLHATLCIHTYVVHARHNGAQPSGLNDSLALPFPFSHSTESRYNVLWRRSAVEVWSVDRARQKRRAAKIKGPIEAAW